MAIDAPARPARSGSVAPGEGAVTNSRMLSPEQIAIELGVSRATVYRLLPELRPIKVGRVWRVQRVDLENWIRRQRQEWNDPSSGTSSDELASAASTPRRTAPPRRPPTGQPSASATNEKHMIRPTQPRTKPRQPPEGKDK